MARRTFFALLAIFSCFFAIFFGVLRFFRWVMTVFWSRGGSRGAGELFGVAEDFFRSDNGGFLRWSADFLRVSVRVGRVTEEVGGFFEVTARVGGILAEPRGGFVSGSPGPARSHRAVNREQVLAIRQAGDVMMGGASGAAYRIRSSGVRNAIARPCRTESGLLPYGTPPQSDLVRRKFHSAVCGDR